VGSGSSDPGQYSGLWASARSRSCCPARSRGGCAAVAKYLARSAASGPDAPWTRKTYALTHRTMEEIAADNDRQWQSNRSDARRHRPSAPSTRGARREPIDLAALPTATLEFVDPMRPLLVKELPRGPQWSYEPKLDGYRALGLKTGGAVQLLSRNENLLNGRFPAIASALTRLPDETLVDGEMRSTRRAGPLQSAPEGWQRTERSLLCVRRAHLPRSQPPVTASRRTTKDAGGRSSERR
jgi:ATP dependent DNA ligase domain